MAGRFKSGARRLGAFAARGLKGTAIQGGTGGAAYYAHKFVNSRVQFAADKPWLVPLGMVVAGHFGRRRFPNAGAALCGAGGYAAAMVFDVQRQNKAATGDTKALTPPSEVDTRALTPPSDIDTSAYFPPDAEAEGDAELDMTEAMSIGL